VGRQELWIEFLNRNLLESGHLEDVRIKLEVIGTGLGLCAVADFGVNSFETLGSRMCTNQSSFPPTPCYQYIIRPTVISVSSVMKENMYSYFSCVLHCF